MSYCRFENTFIALEECYEAMDNKDLSKLEQRYRDRLIELCSNIHFDYNDDDLD